MPNLPTVGADNGTWGQKLNDFLAVAHVTNDPANNGKLLLADEIAQKYTVPPGGIIETDLHANVRLKLNNVGTNVPPNGSVLDAMVSPTAAIAQTKIASTVYPADPSKTL